MSELELFTEALNRTDPAERAAFLDRACAGNPEQRQRLETLLAGHALSHSPLDRPPLTPGEASETADLATAFVRGEYRPDEGKETLAHVDPMATTDVKSGASTFPTGATGEFRIEGSAATIDHADTDDIAVSSKALAPRAARVTTGEGIGTIIAGRYTLVEVIGEGGMGTVYLAEQTEPVKRQVGLKLIKTGMDSRGVLARFDAERQALALMDHPNIARIYDGGLTPAGRPFFVMELVRGVPLTDYCDQRRLTVEDRLELFVTVCQAVQHAHQKGIIHRDLKPGNVLVTEVDGRATPKVIDFGVAKATEVKLTDMSFADTGAIVGTPTYMSPEQADPTSMDIDTRTDVYALGVMLYELLVGSPPIDASQFRRGAIIEMLRMVREVDPPRPSTRLSTADALPNIAANRSIEPARLAKLLQGELDWVVMRALEKDRGRRYDTANGFARDIQRYLADEVVEARPPSRGYRLKKFVKRNKIQVIAAGLVLLTLLGGVVGTTWGLFEARDQRDEARIARNLEAVQRKQAEEQRDRATLAEKAAKLERDRANQEAARATAFSNFVSQMFESVDPSRNGSREVTVLELVNKASDEADKTLKDQPRVDAAVRTFLGRTLKSLGKNEEAIRQLQRALALRKSGADSNTFGHFETLSGLGSALSAKGEDQKALVLHEEALGILTGLRDVEIPALLNQRMQIAFNLLSLSRFEEAERYALQNEQMLNRLPKASPRDRSDVADLKSRLAENWKGDRESAEKYSTDALAFLREEGNELRIADGLNSLAVKKMNLGKVDEAIPLYEESIAIIRRLMGEVHPELAIKLENLANAWFRKKEYAKATGLLNQVAAMRDELFGAGSLPAARTRFNLAVVVSRQGDDRKSVEIHDQVLPVFRQQLGDNSTEVATVLQSRGICRLDLKEYDAALEDFQAALKIANAINQPAANLRIKTLYEMSYLYRLRGNKELADETMRLAFEVLEPTKPSHQTWIKKFKDLPASGKIEEKKP